MVFTETRCLFSKCDSREGREEKREWVGEWNDQRQIGVDECDVEEDGAELVKYERHKILCFKMKTGLAVPIPIFVWHIQ